MCIVTWRAGRGWGGESAGFVVGCSEKGRYLLFKSSRGNTANIPPHCSDNENTCRPGPENSSPEPIIYYNIVLRTFRIYITLYLLFPEFGFTVWWRYFKEVVSGVEEETMFISSSTWENM